MGAAGRCDARSAAEKSNGYGRAAYSVAANIVEGSEREHRKERLNFLTAVRQVSAALHGYIRAVKEGRAR